MSKYDTRHCKQCGKTFDPNSWKQVFCGDTCRKLYYAIEKQKMKDEREAKKNFSLTEIAIAAKKAGMTYGEYVAKNGL